MKSGGGVVGGGRVTFCQQHTLFSHQELSILFDNTCILQNMTLALNFFADIHKFDFL